MNKYVLLCFHTCYPERGLDQVKGSFLSIEECLECNEAYWNQHNPYGKGKFLEDCQYQIIDRDTWKVVAEKIRSDY